MKQFSQKGVPDGCFLFLQSTHPLVATEGEESSQFAHRRLTDASPTPTPPPPLAAVASALADKSLSDLSLMRDTRRSTVVTPSLPQSGLLCGSS